MQTLRYILILIVLVVGAFFPLFWILLFLFTSKREQDKRYLESISVVPSRINTSKSTSTTTNTNKDLWSTADKKLYLKSPQWQTRRKAVLKRDNYICQQCSLSGIPLDVHHLTYAHLGEEPLEDLVSVCRVCHTGLHSHSYNWNNLYPLKD